MQAQTDAPAYLEELKLFSRTIGAILEGYVDDVKPRQLFYEAVRGIAQSLDPYSEFIDPEKFELMKIGMKGEYAGIGTWIRETDGFIFVDRVKPGSVAETGGVLAGDKILSIDGFSVEGKNVGEVGALLRGEPETSVSLILMRPDTGKTFEVELTRERIEIEAIRDVRIVGRAVGYLQILDWQEHTVEQVEKAMDELLEQGMEAVIIDLRGNSGGLLKQAVALSGLFLENGTKLVSVDSKIDVQRQQYEAENTGKVYDVPMIILVNKGSASASEIFSAAMQDNGRATIIGTTTYGKASVQSVIPLDESAALKLTTARYVSPNGRQIDRVGIEPDIVVENVRTENGIEQNQIKEALKLFQEYYS